MPKTMATDRTTIRLTDERRRRLDKARGIISKDKHDDPPMSDVIDAALEHLVQSYENLDDARGELPPDVLQEMNTDVLAVHYRTSLDSRWR